MRFALRSRLRFSQSSLFHAAAGPADRFGRHVGNEDAWPRAAQRERQHPLKSSPSGQTDRFIFCGALLLTVKLS